MTRVRRVRLLAAVGAVAMLASACTLVIGPPPPARPWYCDPTDLALNDGHTAAYEAYYTTPKGPLSTQDCNDLEDILDVVEAYAAQFPTVADAEAAGYREAAVWSSGQGIHYIDDNTWQTFDPLRPNWMMYDGNMPTSQFTGLMFGDASGTTPPAGFPGDNDHWHTHHPLCIRNSPPLFVIAEMVDQAMCASMGGTLTDVNGYWMVHLWLPSYDGWLADDIFNMTHPSLGGGGGHGG